MSAGPLPGPSVSGHGLVRLDDQELAALRAAACCGWTLPPVHLAELGEVLMQRRHQRSPIVLCSAEVTDDETDLDDEDQGCPGCRDCLRYCTECVQEAVRSS